MNIYDELMIEKQIEEIAAKNEGEIPEEAFNALVQAQTQSIEQIESLFKDIRKLEFCVDNCKSEEQRISQIRKRSENRMESIKKYLTPYIVEKGKTSAGTFVLSIRKSNKVIIINQDLIPAEYMQIIPESVVPIKDEIKKAIKSGIEVGGAEIQEFDNLQIK